MIAVKNNLLLLSGAFLVIISMASAPGAAAPILNKEVQVFYPGWAPSGEYLNIRYDLVNTIAWAFIYLNGDGSFDYSDYGNPDNTIAYAHSKGVNVVLSFMPRTNADGDALLASASARTAAINNLYNEVKYRGFDGVDNDIEMVVSSSNWNSAYNSRMTAFQKELAAKFWNDNPDYRISINLAAYYPNTDKLYNVTALQNYANYLMLMGYEWSGTWSTASGPYSPHLLDGGYNGNYLSIRHYETLMDKKKLLLGVPYVGYEFRTVSDARLAGCTGGSCSNAKIIYYKDFIDSVGNYATHFDPVWKTPWYARKDSAGQWYQGHYDDVVSLGQKYDLTNSEGIGGIGIWEIASGSNRPELWQLIQDKFTNTNVSSQLALVLKPGWNQISSPLAAGIDLATIDASCTILPYKTHKLWAWNGQSQVWINPARVEPLKGYWIYAAYQCTVPLSGNQASFSGLQIYRGWNKISAQGTLSAIAGTCSGHITGNWIWNWDKATEKWSHPTTMQLDKGYWIKVDQNCVLGG